MHRKRNPNTGRLAWLFAMLTLYAATVFATVWLTTGQWHQVHQVGFVLGVLATAYLSRSTWLAVLALGRSHIDRAGQLAAARERLVNTGTWRRLGSAPTLRVRNDPRTGDWYVQGYLGAGWDFPDEVRWMVPTRLFQALQDAESGGLRPEGDEGTRVVRARLDLPVWVDPHDPMIRTTIAALANNKASSVWIMS